MARKAVFEFVGDASQLKRELDKASASLGKFEDKAGASDTKARKLGSTAKVALVGGFGAAVVAVKGFIGAAADAQVSQARMETQLKALGISYKAHARQIDQVIQKTSQLSGLDDEDLQNAFTNIVRTTGNVNRALHDTGIAADFARAKHIDVAKAGEIVAKVAGGNTGILSRYGITIKKGADATEALGLLQEKFKGQAKAYGDTAAGAHDRFKVAVENLQESIGRALLPVLTSLADKFASVANWLEQNKTVAKALVVTFTAVATALGAVAVGTRLVTAVQALMTAGQWALNVALSANPIGAVVITVAALAAGMVIAYEKVGFFREAVDTAFGALSSGFGWVRDNWELILGILTGPIGLAVLAISKNADDIVDFFKKLPDRIKTGITTGIHTLEKDFKGAGEWIINRLADGITTITAAVSAVGGWIRTRVRETIEGAIDGFTAAGTWIINRVADGITTITAGVSAVGGWIKNRVSDAVHAVVEDFKSIGGWITGRIMDGIQGAGEAIKDAAKWLRDKIVDAIKSFFGISSPSTVFEELGGHMVTGLIKGLDPAPVVKHLISQFGGVTKLAGKVLGGAAGAIFGQGGYGGGTGTDGHPGNLAKALLPFVGLAHRDGLVITSTTDGHHVRGSNHYTGHAFDTAGAAGAMMHFAQQMLGFAPHLRELFYDPLGVYVKNGSIVRGAIGGHSDHVHVAAAIGGSMPGGMVRVGELGPEDVYLPRGSRVVQASQSRVGGGDVIINGPVTISSERAARRLANQWNHRSRFG